MAINRHTLATDRLDVLLGFSTGDILWYDAVHHKYNRLNKTHALHNKAVTQVAWVPGSECLFVASFSDGVVLVLDKDREDREMEPTAGKETTPSKEKSLDASLVVDELVEQRAAEGFEVFKPRKAHKHNPVSCWRIGQFVYGTGRSVSDVAFSPDGMHVALASLGGSLRVVHFAEERIMDTYKSFYGGLLCVTWSPDGKLIVTGGQDDLISVYSLKERRLIARCRGHTSWVSQIAFDVWRCDSRNYRFGSVGQDGKLLFWDFPVKGHSRMGKIPASTMRSASFTDTMRARAMSGGSVAGPTAAQPGKPEHLVHPALAACESLIMEPIMSETISALPLWSLVFTPDAALVAEKRGRVLVWERPKVTAYSGHSFAGQAQA
ncbi:WD40-repeat-containing domain protein [Blastocladiella britannica]|nr:WD40-repeat-containing domain protein [Blastocladiella britannica]